MKIAVLDIETTGFTPKTGSIVEIAIVLVDSVTKKIDTIFNEVIREDSFNPHTDGNSWIFNNSTLTLEEVLAAKSLEFHRERIQEILTNYKSTSFNVPFDFSFLSDRGFTFTNVDCLMNKSFQLGLVLYPSGKPKIPSVEEVMWSMFPEKHDYIEEHRALDDAQDEAQILIKLMEYKSCDTFIPVIKLTEAHITRKKQLKEERNKKQSSNLTV